MPVLDASRRREIDLPPLAEAAIFLDFDGVLVDLAETPDAIEVPGALPDLLQRLRDCADGALAVVTGRPAADVQARLGKVPRWIAGSHGGERITPDGASAHPLTDSATVRAVRRSVTALNRVGPDLFAEEKPLGAVIHYRRSPAYRSVLERAAHIIAEANPEFEVHEAKMAYELRPKDVGKDIVVREWLERAPFEGRTPVYFGDDLTDEPAMAEVQKAGGVAVKVGEGDSVASERIDAPKDVLALLNGWAERA